MRSRKKTTPAALRAVIGIKDFEMAEILDCSLGAVHSLESGRLWLSEAMATRMSHETGISISWLLGGDPKAPPIARDERPYTLEHFERARAKTERPLDKGNTAFCGLEFYGKARAILKHALPRGDAQLAAYKIGAKLREVARDFGAPEEIPHWNTSAELIDRVRENVAEDARAMGKWINVLSRSQATKQQVPIAERESKQSSRRSGRKRTTPRQKKRSSAPKRRV